MHPDWARSLRDQCAAAGVPFLFKQWGEWAPDGFGLGDLGDRHRLVGEPISMPGSIRDGHHQVMHRVGKKTAGRDLDGRTHDEYPTEAAHG